MIGTIRLIVVIDIMMTFVTILLSVIVLTFECIRTRLETMAGAGLSAT